MIKIFYEFCNVSIKMFKKINLDIIEDFVVKMLVLLTSLWMLKNVQPGWPDWEHLGKMSLLCLPHEMGRHIVFSSVVCPSVRPGIPMGTCWVPKYLLNKRNTQQMPIGRDIRPSVTLSCPLYIFWTPGGIFK